METSNNPAPKNDPNHSNTQPTEYIYEAELLLAYVAQNGLEIDDTIIAVIVNSKYWLEQGEWTPEREIEFWIAFNTIAKLVSPVSVISLKATSSTAIKSSIFREIRRRLGLYPLDQEYTLAEQSVSTYQKWTLGYTILLLIFHGIWLLQSMFIAPILELQQQMDETQKQLTLAKQNPAITERVDEDPRIKELESKLKDYGNSFKVRSEILKKCSPYSTLFKTCSVVERSNIQQPQDAKVLQKTGIQQQMMISEKVEVVEVVEVQEILQQKKFILAILQLSVLPLLYGLLGACVYVLRTLTTEIKTLTYTIESNINYRLRLLLGTLAGLAIGWFTGPNASFSLDALSSETFLLGGLSAQTLSPMALAFLAGYSVEVLFALMDRIIYAFSTKESISPNTFKPGSAINKAASK